MGGRGKRLSIPGRCHSEHPTEAGRERAHRSEADHEADLGDAAVGVAKQRRSSFEPPGHEVPVWWFAEGAGEFAAEVGRRQPCLGCHVGHSDVVRVATIGQVFGSLEMAYGRDRRHVQPIDQLEPLRSLYFSSALR